MTPQALAIRPAHVAVPTARELRTLTSPSPPQPSTIIGAALALGDYFLFYGGAAITILAPWWIGQDRRHRHVRCGGGDAVRSGA